MGTRGIGVPHAVDNGHVPPVVDGLYWTHLRVEADFVVQGNHLVVRNHYRRTVILIQRIGVGYDRVEIVVSPSHLEYN